MKGLQSNACPAITFAAVPPPPSLPTDLPPGCPRLEVFRDGEDLCKRGIMPMHPYGRCEPLPQTDDEADPEVRADVPRISAMGGSAYLLMSALALIGVASAAYAGRRTS